MNAVQVRVAREDDQSTIARFNSQLAFETEGKRLDAETIASGVSAVLRDPAKGIYYVAEIEGQVIGQLMVTYEWSDWRNGLFWWVQSVYVDSSQRGKGVFKQLMAHLTAAARQSSECCGLRLYAHHENRAALEAYRRLGFERLEYEMFEMAF